MVRQARAGAGLLRTLLLAASYVALVPVVSVLALLLAATYFPGPTKVLFGPSFRSLGIVVDSGEPGKAEEALSRTAALEDRLGKLESDIAELVKRESRN